MEDKEMILEPEFKSNEENQTRTDIETHKRKRIRAIQRIRIEERCR